MANYNHTEPWVEEHAGATATSLFSQRPQSPDSGFEEPALYAQPFDLDLTGDHSNHIFSHELQHPFPPINTQIEASTEFNAANLSATAEVFTPWAPKPFSKEHSSPLAPEFSPNPFAKANPNPFAKANPLDPQGPLNSSFLFRQPVWSGVESEGNSCKEVTPISPTAREPFAGEQAGKRRYSVAAIVLIESRLRQKREVNGGVKRTKVLE